MNALRRAKRHRILRLLSGVLTLVAIVVVVARVLPYQVQSLPYVPVVVAFTPWIIIVAVLGLICALVSRRWVVALLAIACTICLVWWEYPFFTASRTLPTKAEQAVAARDPITDDSYARVMTFNVYKGGADPKAIVRLVRDQRVEVLALQETTDDFVRSLEQAGISEYLPYSHVSSSDNAFGNGLWSATPLGDPKDDDVDSSASFMPGGTVEFNGGATQVRFVAVHTTAPVPGYWSEWGRSLEEVAQLQSNATTRYVLMGDFNATLDHTAMRDILGSRFTDAAEQAGHGFTFTWPQDRPWIPAFCGIDHVVLDTGMTAGQMQVVKIAGSDHAALLATIAVG